MIRYRSPYAAGADSLAATLAARELEQQAEQDRARQREVQDRSFGLQQRTVELQEAGARTAGERQAAQDAAARAEGEQAAARAARIKELIPLAEGGDRKAQLELLNLGGKLLPNAPAPPPGFSLPPGGRRYDHTGKLIATAPDRPEKPAAGFKDSPTLPQGVKMWIDSLTTRGIPIEQARRELSAGWAAQKGAHPNADLAQAAEYLSKVYPLAPDPLQGRQPVPMGGGASAPAPPPAAPTPAAAPAGGDDAAAIEFLQQNGAPVTPANIAAVKQRLAAGVGAGVPGGTKR